MALGLTIPQSLLLQVNRVISERGALGVCDALAQWETAVV
jgi:hypothetical protein